MATRKQTMQDPTAEYPPRQKFQPDKLDAGQRLRDATAALAQAADTQTRAQQEAVEAERSQLQITILDAQVQLALLGEFLRGAQADITMLQALRPGLNVLGGQVDEAVRARAINSVDSFFQGIASTREVLSLIEPKVKKLSWDDIQARVWMRDDAYGDILVKDGWLPVMPTRLRLDLFRATKRVAALPAQLVEVRQIVEMLAAAVEKHRRIKDRANGAVQKRPINSTASIKSPELLAEEAAGRPAPVQARADSSFTGIEADDRRNRNKGATATDSAVLAKKGESMQDYVLRANRS